VLTCDPKAFSSGIFVEIWNQLKLNCDDLETYRNQMRKLAITAKLHSFNGSREFYYSVNKSNIQKKRRKETDNDNKKEKKNQKNNNETLVAEF